MTIELHLGDCLEYMKTLPDNCVDVILTDPPYKKEFLPLYGQLAQYGARILRDGGTMTVMCGQTYLPELLNLMTPHLTYRWTMLPPRPDTWSIPLRWVYLTGRGSSHFQ